MHNGELADPMYNFTQAIRPIANKRKKTEADFAEMARLEFLGSLYLNNGRPCIPGEVIEASLVNAAKKQRMGDQAKAGLMCDGMYQLEYDGPTDPMELWEDKRFRFVRGVRVQRNRVMRTRPKFDNWSAEIEIKFLPDIINERQIREIAVIAGDIIGVGDWRPKYGRFEVLKG